MEWNLQLIRLNKFNNLREHGIGILIRVNLLQVFAEEGLQRCNVLVVDLQLILHLFVITIHNPLNQSIQIM